MNERSYEQGWWSLADLIPSADRPEDIGREYLDQLERAISDLEGRRATLSPDVSTDNFVEILDIVEG
ncbi:MAG TPA: hypothetical protein ENL30_00735, partial [Candidatus Acetothermia bacterium]|nr:hypothetical protein [Candidatus Acetothermia bacterium]